MASGLRIGKAFVLTGAPEGSAFGQGEGETAWIGVADPDDGIAALPQEGATLSLVLSAVGASPAALKRRGSDDDALGILISADDGQIVLDGLHALQFAATMVLHVPEAIEIHITPMLLGPWASTEVPA